MSQIGLMSVNNVPEPTKQVSFSGSKIYVQVQAFDSLMESLSSGVGRFHHMIKLIKYCNT